MAKIKSVIERAKFAYRIGYTIGKISAKYGTVFKDRDEAIQVLRDWGKGADVVNAVEKIYKRLLNVKDHAEFDKLGDDIWDLIDRHHGAGFDSQGYSEADDAAAYINGTDIYGIPHDVARIISSVADFWNQLKDINDYYNYADDPDQYLKDLSGMEEMQDLKENIDYMKIVKKTIEDFIKRTTKE